MLGRQLTTVWVLGKLSLKLYLHWARRKERVGEAGLEEGSKVRGSRLEVASLWMTCKEWQKLRRWRSCSEGKTENGSE